MTEDEMVGQHHRLNGHEFEQILEDGEGQGSLVGCSPWGRKESEMTEQPNNSKCSTTDNTQDTMLSEKGRTLSCKFIRIMVILHKYE